MHRLVKAPLAAVPLAGPPAPMATSLSAATKAAIAAEANGGSTGKEPDEPEVDLTMTPATSDVFFDSVMGSEEDSKGKPGPPKFVFCPEDF